MSTIKEIPEIENNINEAINYYAIIKDSIDIANNLSGSIREIKSQLERNPGLAKPYDPIPDVV